MSEQSQQVRRALGNLGEHLSSGASWREFSRIQASTDFSNLAQGLATTQKVAQVYRALPLPLPPMSQVELVRLQIMAEYNKGPPAPELVPAPDEHINPLLQRLHGLPAYFHGTSSLANVISMLKAGGVAVCSDSGIPGAFASNIPEPRYGPYYFAFSRSIEFEQALVSCRNHGSDYWPGFNGINTSDDNVMYIVINTDHESIQPGEVERTQQAIRSQTERNIKVISLKEMKKIWQDQMGTDIEQTQSVVPRHWPDAQEIIFS